MNNEIICLFCEKEYNLFSSRKPTLITPPECCSLAGSYDAHTVSLFTEKPEAQEVRSMQYGQNYSFIRSQCIKPALMSQSAVNFFSFANLFNYTAKQKNQPLIDLVINTEMQNLHSFLFSWLTRPRSQTHSLQFTLIKLVHPFNWCVPKMDFCWEKFIRVFVSFFQPRKTKITASGKILHFGKCHD